MELITLEINAPNDPALDVATCIAAANDGAEHGDERWRSLWLEPMKSEHLKAVQELKDSLAPSCRNLVVLGIGGSALGAKSLDTCLTIDDSPALFVLDTIDPHTVNRTIRAISSSDPTFEYTVVVIISKSGETAEIAALQMIFQREMLRATFVAITGSSGTLHQIATEKKWPILPIPEGVGGRFSVLSPVGLFTAAMRGVNIEELLVGAAMMDVRCKQLDHNPAAALAVALVSSLHENRNVHVMMPYCDRLVQFSHWYVQLWAESLGKRNSLSDRVGPTPVPALGATDQHSMLQLWREGPEDKVIGFIRVLEVDDIELGMEPISPTKQWLCGHTLGSLLQAEQHATEHAMRDSNQATWTLTLPRIDAASIGQFIALWQVTVAIAGRLLNINPYDQPGVELGKQLTRSSLEELSC